MPEPFPVIVFPVQRADHDTRSPLDDDRPAALTRRDPVPILRQSYDLYGSYKTRSGASVPPSVK